MEDRVRHVVGKRGGGMHTALQWVNLKERSNVDNLEVDGNTML
jgi:hypothetical protein